MVLSCVHQAAQVRGDASGDPLLYLHTVVSLPRTNLQSCTLHMRRGHMVALQTVRNWLSACAGGGVGPAAGAGGGGRAGRGAPLAQREGGHQGALARGGGHGAAPFLTLMTAVPARYHSAFSPHI